MAASAGAPAPCAVRPFDASRGDHAAVCGLFSSGIMGLVPRCFAVALVGPAGLAVGGLALLAHRLRGPAAAAAAAAAGLAAVYLLTDLRVGQYVDGTLKSEMMDIESQFVRGGGCYLIAEVDGRLAGTLALQRVRDDSGAPVTAAEAAAEAEAAPGPKIAEMKRVSTVPSFKRRGVATALLRAADAFCETHGITRVVLSTSSVQHEAQRMYAAAGFRLARIERVPLHGVFYHELSYVRDRRKGDDAAAATVATAPIVAWRWGL